jgi:DNA mismatch endonuclease (patch repair protein)
MPDVFTKAKRSDVMSRIKGSGNKSTELKLISVFKTYKITGWRRHRRLEGKPDLVFPNLKLAVFIDGCFWHGCPIHAIWPKQNATFWCEKITKNKARDRFVSRTLRAGGWKVLRIWEHELTLKNEPRIIARLRRAGLFEPFLD